MKPLTFAIIAFVLWTSAVALFLIGSTPGTSVLRYAAIPDALGAAVFTWMAVQKWMNNSNKS